MSIKYNIGQNGCEIRVMDKNGIETVIKHEYEKALNKDQIVSCMKNNTKAAASMRAASLSFIHLIQESGVLTPYFNSGKVSADLLKKMREAEGKLALEFGMTADDISEMRKPGSYADSRSHALKAWGFGVPLKTGVDEKGNVNLLTTSALRQINASKRNPPEKRTINDLLEAVAKHLTERPQDVVAAETQMANMVKAAKAMLDSAAKILAGATVEKAKEPEKDDKSEFNTVKPEAEKPTAFSRKEKAAMLHASKQPVQANKPEMAMQ